MPKDELDRAIQDARECLRLREYGPPHIRYDTIETLVAALTPSEQGSGLREALEEARDVLDRLLDYALTHDCGLVESENEGHQSPLVTNSKRIIAKIDALSIGGFER